MIVDQNEKHAGPHSTVQSSEGCTGVSEYSPENIKVSHPFLDQETSDEPCLSVLFAVADFMPRREDPSPVQTELSSDDNLRGKMGELRKARMSPSDRKFFYDGLETVRGEAGKLLTFLVLHDDRIDTRKCRILKEAVEVLNNHGPLLTVHEEPVPAVTFKGASPHPWMDPFFYPRRGGVS